MSKQDKSQEIREIEQQAALPVMQLPDADSTAAVVLSQAMEYCARKMRMSGPESAVEAIRQGKLCACNYCNYSIAQQVAEALGALDENVQAVYLCEIDATPDDVCFGEGVQGSPIHLIVWSKRKTNALQSLVSALDRALAEQYAEMVSSESAVHILDAQIVDDADVQARVGYGALIMSMHNPPLRIWNRSED